MKLAIICEIPRQTIRFSDRLPDSIGPICANAEVIRERADLSAHAEKSAKDAFAYCKGPFESMGFVRETPGSVARARQVGADWILFMAHDCLVDIQAFEAVGLVLELAMRSALDATMIKFLRWSTGGLSGEYSRFSFQKTIFAASGLYPIEARHRILIEPEPESAPKFKSSCTKCAMEWCIHSGLYRGEHRALDPAPPSGCEAYRPIGSGRGDAENIPR